MGELRTIKIPNTHPAKKLGTVRQGQKVHMQVINAAVTILFAKSRETLETPIPFLPESGYAIDSTSGLVEIQWEGELYAIGAAANATDVQLRFGID